MPVALISTRTSPAFGPSRSTSTISSGFFASNATAARVFIYRSSTHFPRDRTIVRLTRSRLIRRSQAKAAKAEIPSNRAKFSCMFETLHADIQGQGGGFQRPVDGDFSSVGGRNLKRRDKLDVISPSHACEWRTD